MIISLPLVDNRKHDIKMYKKNWIALIYFNNVFKLIYYYYKINCCYCVFHRLLLDNCI